MIKNAHLLKTIEKFFDREFYVSCYADYLAKMSERMNALYEYADYLFLNTDEVQLRLNGYGGHFIQLENDYAAEYWSGPKPDWAWNTFVEIAPGVCVQTNVLVKQLFIAKTWATYGDVGHEQITNLISIPYRDVEGNYKGNINFDINSTLSNLQATFQTSSVYAATIRTLSNLKGVVDKTFSNVKNRIVDTYKTIVGSFDTEPVDYILNTFTDIALTCSDAIQLIGYINDKNNPDDDMWVNSYDNQFYNMTGATYSAICTLAGLAIDSAAIGVKVTFGLLYSIGYAIGKGLLYTTYQLINWVEQLGRTVEIKINKDLDSELIFDNFTMFQEMNLANRDIDIVNDDLPIFWSKDDGLVTIKTVFGIIQFKTSETITQAGSILNPVAYRPRYCNPFVIQDWMNNNGLNAASTSIQEIDFTEDLIESLVNLMLSPSAADVTFPHLDASTTDLKREEYIAAGFVVPQVLISEILSFIYLNTVDEAAVEGSVPKFKVIPYGLLVGNLMYTDDDYLDYPLVRSNPNNKDWVRLATGANDYLEVTRLWWTGIGVKPGVNVQSQYPFFSGGIAEFQFAPGQAVTNLIRLMCALKKTKSGDDIGGGFVPYSRTITAFPAGAFSIMSDFEVATGQIARQLITWAAAIVAVTYGVIKPIVKKKRLKKELAYRTRIEEVNAKIRNGTATTTDLKFAQTQTAKLNKLNRTGLSGNLITADPIKEPEQTQIDLSAIQQEIESIKGMINSQ